MERTTFSDKVFPVPVRLPRWNELPDIDLYMDQTVAFINSKVGIYVSHLGGVPLTKSMVNNYVKAKVVNAPVNKKYDRLTIAMIIVVYILKSCFSTDDIRNLIQLGIAIPGNDITYDRFCDSLENALKSVFSGSIHIDDLNEAGRESRYLMDNFSLAVACKAYVQRSFMVK